MKNKEIFRKVLKSLFKFDDSGTVFSFCLFKSKIGFSVDGSSTSVGLFQTINGLKRLMGYLKRLHQLKHGVFFHLKTENLKLFVKLKLSISNFFR